MTKERREDVVLVAVAASLLVHVGVMLLAKPHVMTLITRPTARPARHMKAFVTKAEERPDPARINEIMDLAALKDAPAVRADVSLPLSAAPSAEEFRAIVPPADAPASSVPVPETLTVFETKPVGTMKVSPKSEPAMPIETPPVVPKKETAPVFSPTIPEVFRPTVVAAPKITDTPQAVFLPSTIRKTEKKDERFVPAAEVYEKVEESVVAQEKKAVRNLVEAEDALELSKFVNLTMSTAEEHGWRYFKVIMTARANLMIVPKDVVVIIDGSGSIGNDRLGSCRKAARRMLRNVTNSGDRFNLVVFRNAFSYAFRNWRECDAESFAAGDEWLNRQTAHGRTDVFSTISSVLTLPRDPKRPLIALVVTDGDANAGVSDTSEILSRFTALNDGLVSVYMYGVKSSANRELIDVLTHGNRGEGYVFEGMRWNAGEEMDTFSLLFRDPVLTDLRVIFSSATNAEAYPRLLRNIYRGGTLSFVGRIPISAKAVSFSLKGLNADLAYEGFFNLPFATASDDSSIVEEWWNERALDMKLRKE